MNRLSPVAKATIFMVAFLFLAAIISYKYLGDYEDRSASVPQADSIAKIYSDGTMTRQMVTIDGAEVKVSALQGKVVIVNFWASWCEPCVKEFPSMLKLLSLMPNQIVLVAISGDYELQDLKNFLRAFDVTKEKMTVVWDQDMSHAKAFGTQRLPESYIYGPDGNLIRKIVGVEDWATQDAIEYFKTLLLAK